MRRLLGDAQKKKVPVLEHRGASRNQHEDADADRKDEKRDERGAHGLARSWPVRKQEPGARARHGDQAPLRSTETREAGAGADERRAQPRRGRPLAARQRNGDQGECGGCQIR
jgi:hypothetical protein